MLLIVMLIVAVMAMKSWTAVAPTAVGISTPERTERDAVRAEIPVQTMQGGAPGTAARPFSPNMTAMQEATAAHSAAVQDGAAATE